MGVIKGDTKSLDYGSFGNNSIGKVPSMHRGPWTSIGLP